MVRKRSTVAALTTALVMLALNPVPMTKAGAQAPGRSSTDPVAIARAHLAAHAAELGVTRADVTDLAVASSYESSHNRVTHVNLTQRFEGLEVFGAHATVNVAEDGEVLFVGDSLVTGLSPATPAAPRVDAGDAVAAAAEELDLDDPDGLRVIDGPTGRAQKTVVSKAGISSTPIPARLGWQPAAGGLRLCLGSLDAGRNSVT
jgi:extracellular elastinolytic metalloproteinase